MKNEKTHLIKLPVKDLAKKIICEGHLFLSIGERKYYLMKPGVFVDPDFIKKHAINNPVFDFDSVINEEVKEKFKSYLRELKYLQFEKDLREKCLQIVSYFHKVYSDDEHFLTFALACHEELCQIPIEAQTLMHETDMHLFRKALYSSSFAVITAMTNDFYYYLMLKDFFNLTFSLDMGLCDSNYSYFVAEACNAENKIPGSGKLYLETERASEFEIQVFLSHPKKSYEYLKDNSFLSFSELAEAALYQHELSDGSGFPRGVLKGQVSSWEAVIVFSDSLVEILPEYQFERSVIDYLLNFQNQKMTDLPVNKVYKKLCLAFEHFNSLKETGS
jgi:HD domain